MELPERFSDAAALRNHLVAVRGQKRRFITWFYLHKRISAICGVSNSRG